MGIIDTVIEGIQQGLGFLVDAIGNTVMNVIFNVIGIALYYLTKMIMWFIWVLQQLFDVFAGTTKVMYKGEFTYLIDVFFQNESIVNVYWAMALLGIVFVIVFTLIAVVRKTFDIDEQQKLSHGQILSSMFKSIFMMLILSIVMNAAISIVNVTINRVSYIFDNADSFSKEKEITFTDDQFATMARIYKTIGNYSLNPSYQSRYNLNSCFNDIRSDLNLLEKQGVFDLTYITTENGKEIDTWQSVLQSLVYSADTSRDLRLDKYYNEVADPLLKIMDILRTNPSFYPLQEYKNGFTVSNGVSLDRVLFLSGTVTAANNPKYNQNPYLTDGLRGAFYSGIKDIYDYEDVNGAFNIGLMGINYPFIWILTYFVAKSLLNVIFGCIMRIFTMVSLYIIAPVTIASTPIDGGEKFKQWMTSMIVQSLSILGSIIPMRLIILFAPIILSNDLQIFDSIALNFIAKILLVVGGLEAVEGFGGILRGILANSAGMQSLRQDDRAAALGSKTFSGITGPAKSTGKVAAKGVGYTALGVGAVGLGAAAVGVGGAVIGAAAGVAGAYQGLKAIGNGTQYLMHKFGKKDEHQSGFDEVPGSAATGGDTGASTPDNLQQTGSTPENQAGTPGGQGGSGAMPDMMSSQKAPPPPMNLGS